ncbi:MAG: sigma-70 family RNA polymerase sigma factor [Gammaproteobacteria bacterium]
MPPLPDHHCAQFEQLRPRLIAISRRIVGDQADAEDIVQDCFLKWHRARQDAVATPAAWLTTVVQHQSIDRLRQRTRDAAAAHIALELAAEGAPALPEDALLRRAELGEALARLLACLSPSERMALVLHEAFECRHADIAAALGTTAVNARQYLARARRRLREHSEEASSSEKLCRELVRQFQAAINGLDAPAVLTLLADEQPMAVRTSPQLRFGGQPCANDALYDTFMAA